MSGQLIIQRGVAAGGGGGGTPGGADTQVQFNDGGAFGGDAGLTFNKTTDLLTADHILLAQGTITDPELNLSGTVTWNDAADTFTAWRLNVTNTASAATSLLLDLQVGGVSRFSISPTGRIEGVAGANISLLSGVNLHDGGGSIYIAESGQMRFPSTANFGFTSALFTGGSAIDTGFRREAAGVMAQRDGTSAQAYRLYTTWTNTSNYERLTLSTTAATKVTLAAETAGTGGDNLDVELLPAGTGAVQFSNPIDGAAAATGTLTNAPTAGNPSIWLKVKVGANVRYIPAWA